MQVITPEESEIREIQRRDDAFYFSCCFEAVLTQNGIVASDSDPLGPGIATRGFADIERLDPARPYVFEGPLSDEVIAADGLIAKEYQTNQLSMYRPGESTSSQFCYQTIRVRRIPPVGSKEKPKISLHEPEDSRWFQEQFVFQAFELTGGARPILYAKLPDGEQVVVGVQKGKRIYLGIPLLGVIAQHLSCPPIHGTSFYLPDRYCVPYYLWILLREIVRELASETGWPYLCVAPWPVGKRAAFCIRHDFDRPAKRKQLNDLLSFYDAHGVKSTWFWRLCQADADLFDLVRQHGHELALHTEKEGWELFQEEEVKVLTERYGLDIRGYSAHGGRGSCGYLGQRQFEWAARAGFDYAELLVVDSGLPYPCIVVRNELPETVDNLWMPGTHYSIDRGTAPDAYDLDAPREYAERRIQRGEQIVIMNHPDIHLEQLKEFIADTDFKDIWHATLLESVQWCGQRAGLRSGRTAAGEISVTQAGALDHDVELWLEGLPSGHDAERYRLPAGFQRAVLRDGTAVRQAAAE